MDFSNKTLEELQELRQDTRLISSNKIETDLEIINEGVKKASLLIPHDDDL